MHEQLLRQALESGKTTSRKARSKVSSAAVSKTTSPAASRPVSRNTSHQSDSDSDSSDDSDFTTYSTTDLVAPEDPDSPLEVKMQGLSTRIEQITNRKRSSVQGREESLNGFAYALRSRYALMEISPSIEELVPAILKSVKASQTEKETVLALKALALILATVPSENIYDAVSNPTKKIITDSPFMLARVAAIHTLGAATFFGGAGEEETQEIMSFLFEIIESDGCSIEADDNGKVVTAALEEWGFLATNLYDMEEASEEAIEVFAGQLESSDVGVQVAAGENIALLYEKSYTPLEEGEQLEVTEEDSDEEGRKSPKQVKRYTVYRREDQLKDTLGSLASTSSRRLSKKDRKILHSSFADILNSVEHPTRGPCYSNAIDDVTGYAYGSRMSVGIGRSGQMTIQSWWKLHRLRAMKRIFQSGFIEHASTNPIVLQSLLQGPDLVA